MAAWMVLDVARTYRRPLRGLLAVVGISLPFRR